MSLIHRSGRRPATLKRVGAKRRRSKLGTKRDPVYQDVDARSGELCEVAHRDPHRGAERHHLFHPRMGTCERCGIEHLPGHHRKENILRVCRSVHREFEREYSKGRRVPTWFNTVTGRFDTTLVFAADKWAARIGGIA